MHIIGAIRLRMAYQKVQDILWIPCLFILCLVKGAQAAEEQVISDSGAIALASVIGALVLVVTIAVLCYCFRKYTLESKERSRKLAEINNNLVESQLKADKMTQNGYVAANGHVSDKMKTYGEWRKSQRPSNLHTKHYASVGRTGATHYTTTAGHYATVGQNTMGYRIRKGSESPPLSPRSPGQDRGRSARRQFVYQMPAGSVAVRRAVVRPKLRSKSAPPVHRYNGNTGYNVVYPKFEKVGYTRNHFLSIKKPFGKKYLLPPTLVYKEQPKVIQKNVVVPVPQPRPVQITQQQPRETIKGNVYHIKYEEGQNQRLSSSNGYTQRLSSSNGYADQSFSHSRVEQQYSYPRTEQYTYTRSEQKHSYPRNVTTSTSRTYAEPSSPVRPATYTVKYGDDNYDLVNEKSNIYTLQTSGAANQSLWRDDVNYRNATTVYTANDDEDTGEVFRQSIISSEVRANVKEEGNEEQYTIVDFVEPTGTQTANPASTSTPRFAEEDVTETEPTPTTPVTPLRDLDNVLNGNDSSTSSSASNSSRRSSGSDGNQ